MFKAIKKGKIIGINETGDFPLMNYDTLEEDTEHQLSDYIHCDGEFVLTSSAEAIEQREAEVRSIRNQYLADTDKYMIPDFPITEEEEAQYIQYREYLRNYPETENWFEQNPMTFGEWSNQDTEQESGLEQTIVSGD